MSLAIGLLILRLVVGGVVAAHGAQKLFGWWGGPGFAGLVKMTGSHMRLRPAAFWAVMAVASEFGGGVLLALGLLSPLGALGIVASMLMAALLFHWPQFWATKHGMEYPLVLLAGGVVLGLTGPGAYSLDALLGFTLDPLPAFLGGLVLVLLGVAAAFLTRVPSAAPASAEAITPATR